MADKGSDDIPERRAASKRKLEMAWEDIYSRVGVSTLFESWLLGFRRGISVHTLMVLVIFLCY